MRTPRDRRHPHRWDEQVYREQNSPIFLTICTKGRQRTLVPDLGDMVVETLRECAERFGMRLHAYCIMPDHLHVVCSVIVGHGRFEEFVKRFKSDVSRHAHYMGNPDFAWQRSGWDRHARYEDDVPSRMKYTLDNPVRWGLCAHWTEWHWSWWERGKC